VTSETEDIWNYFSP